MASNSNSNYKAKAGSLKSPQVKKQNSSTGTQKQASNQKQNSSAGTQKQASNQKQNPSTGTQITQQFQTKYGTPSKPKTQKKATNPAATNYSKLNNSASATTKKQNNNNQKTASYYNNVNYSMPKKDGGYYSSPNYSMPKNTITSIKTKINTPVYYTSNINTYNNTYNSNNVELFNVETGTIENLKIKAEDIDLSRISASAYNAQNSNFVRVNEDVWKSADLNITEREDGTFLIKNGDVPIGFTDAKGLDSLLNGKNNGTQPTQKTDEKADGTPTTQKNDGTQKTDEKADEKADEKNDGEKTYSQNEETGFEGGGFVLHSGYELDMVYRTIEAEGGNISPEEAKNIASTLINRARAGSGYGTGKGYGNDIYRIAAAPGQFTGYTVASKNPQGHVLNEESRKAVDELFASCAEGGETTHNYTFFRSNDSYGYDGIVLDRTGRGNRYGNY